MTQPQIKIDDPCPMLLNRMDKRDKDFHCGSCNKLVVDFRNRSNEEIRDILSSSQGQCGIFLPEQLTQQHEVRHTWSYKVAFVVLVIMSWFGSAVQPLNAQSAVARQQYSKTKPAVCYDGDYIHKKAKESVKDRKKDARLQKRWLRKSRAIRGKIRTIGCPSF